MSSNTLLCALESVLVSICLKESQPNAQKREDNGCEKGLLDRKVTKCHLSGHLRDAESYELENEDHAGDLTDGSSYRVSTLSTVKKHHHKHSIKHRYQILETLGRGTYGKVKRAMDKGTGKLVAVKSIQKDKITDELDKVHLQREIEITALLKHEHIIQVFEVFESRGKIIIVMEYASKGELYDFINDKHQIPESEARRFFRQIVSAVHYCHKNGIVHRDIKLENILLDDNLNVKLADFGLSNLFHKGQVLETYCGSPLYASPEIVKGLPYYGPEVDCWALGVLLYALVYGTMPFDNSNYTTLTEQISSGQYRQPPHLSGACGLIDWMLTVNPTRRATVEDIASHWWVNWGYDSVVCDCDKEPDCHSPLLARYIECQNMSGFRDGTKKHFRSQLKEQEEYEVCLRKSKKENDIIQSQQEIDFNINITKPKGILKKRGSFDSALLNTSSFSEDLSQNCYELNRDPQSPSSSSLHKTVYMECTFKLPKKGILKKTYERESGYSSSPERSISAECQQILRDGQDKAKSEKHFKKKKGILKKNGKFSNCLDLSVESKSLSISDSLEDLTISNAEPTKSPSRPSSVISDDSFLSSDSFDLLDISSESKGQILTYNTQNSIFSSEDKLSGKLTERHSHQTYCL
ncbi:NUAK family SNF1-like kinase 1 [Bombina bombina]|uniref:NUAK family SNF1-like kinase 1 n=1 Tax=Bombina bombina TaxID=8345 RepID=UPI00235AB873|nr:NUAK family SNF1-like kinase 1 [Bombina bombina]